MMKLQNETLEKLTNTTNIIKEFFNLPGNAKLEADEFYKCTDVVIGITYKIPNDNNLYNFVADNGIQNMYIHNVTTQTRIKWYETGVTISKEDFYKVFNELNTIL